VIGGAYAYVICMYDCVLLLGCVYLYVGILCAKTFSGFSIDLSSSIKLEDVGFINSRGECWHKQTWSKELIKPNALRSYLFNEDWWGSTWRLSF